MSERRTWTSQEDEALRILKDQRKIKKWSKISYMLQSEFGIIGRNGKQCRERYHNHLDKNIVKEEWTEEENEKLVDLHNKLGNRWASIARALNGRTDNCVKNHFYSQFRKAIRIINDLMKKNGIKSFKPIKTSFIKQIIGVTEVENRKEENISDQFQKMSQELQEEMLKYSLEQFQEGNELSLRRILELLQEFQKKYKAFNLHTENKKEETKHEQNIFYSDDENPKDMPILEKKESEDQIYEEESEVKTPYTLNPQELSLKGISSFLDRHLDSAEKELDPSFLSSWSDEDLKENTSNIQKQYYEEPVELQL